MRSFSTFACLLVAGATAGCLGTETGNPQLRIDDRKVLLVETSPGTLHIEGSAGAVTPTSATVRLLDLEGADGFRTIAVEPDGSFNESFAGDAARLFRAEATLDAERSAPIDVRVVAPGGPRRCLQTTPALAAELGPISVGGHAPLSIQLVNLCSDIALGVDARERLGNADFTLMTPAPIAIAAGGSATATVDFVPRASGLSEAVLVLTDRGDVQALSLRGHAR